MVHQLEYGFDEVKVLYFLEPEKSLEEGLKLLFDDTSVLELSNHLNRFGEISVYVDHVGDGNEKSSDIPLPQAFFMSADEPSDEDGKEGTRKGVEDDLNTNVITRSSDEGGDELALVRQKVRENEKESQSSGTGEVECLGPSGKQGTEDWGAGPLRKHGATDNQAVPLPSRVGVDGQSVMYSSSDNEPKSTHIDSDDPGSYITTSDGSDADDARRVPSRGLYNPAVGDHCFYVGQIFRDAAQFKTALKDHSLRKQFKYRYKKNEQVRVRAKCAANGCHRVILASRHGNDNSFRVKTYFPEHSCSPTTHNKRVTPDVMLNKERGRKGLEGPKKMSMSRVGVIIRCSLCHKEGHNRTRCPMMPDVQSSSNPGILKSAANKRKASGSTSTAPKAARRNDGQSSKRMKTTTEAL
ncbi:hypothetical protein V6N13_088717 [Hibiscus sabdariffa]|uniref:Transposase MuDR plant domain-containing protein n=1 Tax=Hibiscus sabdariffa TaxID=183260 RepID=A0ABR2G0N0_9ROSI